MALARAALESLLRTRQLDRTLTTACPDPEPENEYAIGPTGVDRLDARLGGGLPRGQLSELVGPRTSGRLSVLLQMLAEATRRGELVAVVDALDMLDVASLEAAGVVLDRVLWIRGHVVINPGLCRDANQRAMEQAIRALALVLQAGNFGLVVLDVAEAPVEALRRLPFTTWLRLQRMVEGTQTIAVLVGRAPIARSSAGLTIGLEARRPAADRSVMDRPAPDLSAVDRPIAAGPVRVGEPAPGDRSDVPRWLQGLDVEGQIRRARLRGADGTPARFATRVHVHV